MHEINQYCRPYCTLSTTALYFWAWQSIELMGDWHEHQNCIFRQRLVITLTVCAMRCTCCPEHNGHNDQFLSYAQSLGRGTAWCHVLDYSRIGITPALSITARANNSHAICHRQASCNATVDTSSGIKGQTQTIVFMLCTCPSVDKPPF